jgi:hypothetical protein
LLAVVLGTSAALLAVALTAYLQSANWAEPQATLAPRMGRVNALVASGVVRAAGVLGAWRVCLAMAGIAVRLAAGRPVAGLRRRVLLAGAAAALLAQAFVALPAGDLSPGRELFAGWIGRSTVAGLRGLFGGLGAAIALVGATAALFATLGLPLVAPLARLRGPLAAAFRSLGGLAARAVRDAWAGLRPGDAWIELSGARAGADADDEEEEVASIAPTARKAPVAEATRRRKETPTDPRSLPRQPARRTPRASTPRQGATRCRSWCCRPRASLGHARRPSRSPAPTSSSFHRMRRTSRRHGTSWSRRTKSRRTRSRRAICWRARSCSSARCTASACAAR